MARDNDELPETMKAFLQQMMASKVINDSSLQNMLRVYYHQNKEPAQDNKATIVQCNKALADLKLKIVTIKEGETISHVLVNLIADDIAKKFGSCFTDWQMETFKRIVAKFGEAEKEGQQLTAEDLAECKTTKVVTQSDMEEFIELLVREKWLKSMSNEGSKKGEKGKKRFRDFFRDTSFRLGARAYAELPELLRHHDITVPQTLYY